MGCIVSTDNCIVGWYPGQVHITRVPTPTDVINREATSGGCNVSDMHMPRSLRRR
jgi:hypothetical protein